MKTEFLSLNQELEKVEIATRLKNLLTLTQLRKLDKCFIAKEKKKKEKKLQTI